MSEERDPPTPSLGNKRKRKRLQAETRVSRTGWVETLKSRPACGAGGRCHFHVVCFQEKMTRQPHGDPRCGATVSNTYIGGTLLAGGTTFRWHTACGGDHTQYTMNRCEPCIKRHCPVGKWRALLGELSMQYIVIHHEHQWQAKIHATKKWMRTLRAL